MRLCQRLLAAQLKKPVPAQCYNSPSAVPPIPLAEDVSYLKQVLCLPDGEFSLLPIVFGYPRGSYLLLPPKLPPDQIRFENRYCEPNRAVDVVS